MNSNEARFLMYRAAGDEVTVNELVKDDTIWLNQKAMAELFDVSTSSISRYLKNIFDEGELDEKVVIAEIATTTQHGAMEGKTPKITSDFDREVAKLTDGQKGK